MTLNLQEPGPDPFFMLAFPTCSIAASDGVEHMDMMDTHPYHAREKNFMAFAFIYIYFGGQPFAGTGTETHHD